MSIIKEKNGTFTVRWRETNPLTGEVKHKGKRGFQTKREARDFELSVGNVNHTFRTLMEDYLNSQNGYANEDTIHTKRRLYEMYCDALMSKEIAEISTKVINAWKNQVYELSLSKTTKNRLITIVKSLSKYGYTNYDLNDFAKSLKRFPKTSDDVHDMNIISPQEFQRLIDNCPNPIYRKFFIFLYHTGCRRGEAIALNKADISNGRANLNKSIRRSFSPNNRLKNAQSKRSILLDEYTLKELEPLMKLPGDYVFGGEEPLCPTSIDRHFKSACKAAKIQRIRIHDLRHSFISNAILNGMNIVTVSKYVGHKNVTTTLNQYSHVLKDSEEDLIKGMSKIYQNFD